jgi:WD40 repeat protein
MLIGRLRREAENAAQLQRVATERLTGTFEWDPAIGKATTFKVVAMMVESVAFSPDGRTLATGHADDPVRLWQVRSPFRGRWPGRSACDVPWGRGLRAACWRWSGPMPSSRSSCRGRWGGTGG